MNKEQFEKLEVGDEVVVTGNTHLGHGFDIGSRITIDEIYNDVHGYDEYGLSQWVSMKDIEYEK